MGIIIPMDQDGYNRLTLEIEAARSELQRIQQSLSEQMRSQRSDDALMDACGFITLERQAAKKLDDLLMKKQNAQIVESNHAADVIGFGSIVKILFMEDSDSTMELKVVSASPRDGEVSVQSPIGKALYGHKVGDVIGYNVGDCFFQAKVVSVD